MVQRSQIQQRISKTEGEVGEFKKKKKIECF